MLDLAVYFFISETFGGVELGVAAGSAELLRVRRRRRDPRGVVDATSVSVASRLREEQLTGTLEALTTQPLTPLELCVRPRQLSVPLRVLRAGLFLRGRKLLRWTWTSRRRAGPAWR